MAKVDIYAHAREETDLTDTQLKICERIMLGESVLAICKDEDMPARSTVMGWIAKDLNFRSAYLASKAILAEQFAEEIIEISDDASNDYTVGPDGKELDRENIQRARLRVDSRKWLAGKLAPKRYGDRIDVTSGGEKLQREAGETEKFSRLAALMAEKRAQGVLPDFSGGED